MLDIRVGQVSTVGVHVVVNMVKNPCKDGFEEKDGFVIQDINPENRPGQPKFLAEVEAVSHEVVSPEGKIISSWIDIEKLDNFSNLLEHLVTIKKGENKIRVAVNFGSSIMSRSAIQTVVILGNKFKEIISLVVYLDNPAEVNEMKKIINSVLGMIQMKKDLCLDSDEFKTAMTNMYQNKLLSPQVSNIVERSYGLHENLTGKKVILVDTHNFYYRQFFGMGAADLRTRDGRPTGVVKAFVTFLKNIRASKPDYVVFLSEGHGSFRVSEYSAYKSNRETPPEELISQINICNELVQKMGMKVFKVDGFEADDGIASFAKRFRECGATVSIYSTDKDLYQLIGENVTVYDTMKNKIIGVNECVEKFGVVPEKMVEFQAIVGDTSDCVPGIKGQGPGKASALLNQYGSIDGIYANIEELKGKQKESFIEEKETLLLSKKLVTLYSSLAEDEDLESYAFPEYDFFKLIHKDLESFEINL